MCKLLIVHTSEAQDWANYLKLVLEASHHFPRGSITFYVVDEASPVDDEDFSVFCSSKCTLLLLSLTFIEIQSEPVVRNTLDRVLYPPDKVVAFLCGVSESDGLTDYFAHWDRWRKLHSDDDPELYVSTVLDVIAMEHAVNLEDHAVTDNDFPPIDPSMILPPPEEPEQYYPSEDQLVSPELLPPPMSPAEENTCLTVQPQRILCGTHEDVYIVVGNKLDIEASVEVEFHCEQSTKRVPGTTVNEFIVRVPSPDMPAGDVSLCLYNNELMVCSTAVTYYTEMEEICRYLKEVLNPVHFICQAFNISSSSLEEVDNLLTDSLKSQMPADGLQVFGVNQLDEDETLSNQRDVELPTLLHFSAKYGLKKLMSTLLHCPGALQAYSIANKNGDYPNTLAEKSGYPNLRKFMDEYVETIDLVKSHIEDSMPMPEDEDIYEPMANATQDFVDKFTLQDDIYMSMMQLNPDIDVYEDFSGSFNGSLNPEAMLRKFFQAQPTGFSEVADEDVPYDEYDCLRTDEAEEEGLENNVEREVEGEENEEEDEDPYKVCFQDEIYDTIDEEDGLAPAILNRPPAPIPRPSAVPESEECKTYISTVFSSKNALYAASEPRERGLTEEPNEPPCSVYDPYAGMKTPGQRQLISLQERVKVGGLTVEEAVQEFKAWQFDQERRSQSVRFQQDNLQKLRNSIIRRNKAKGKSGKVQDLNITAPMQRNMRRSSEQNMECLVYEPAPRTSNQPPPVTQPPPFSRPVQRGTWHTGSTSSTSSSGSNRLSTLSTISGSSLADGDLEEPPEHPPPPRPPRPAVELPPPTLPPPRIPPRIPERLPESMLHERYISAPTRFSHPAPHHRSLPPPPTARRPQ